MLNKGRYYEQQALKFLKQQGLKLRKKNYHCKMGEIDLIMEHNATLVFVEVRYREQTRHGSAIESITPNKQKRIISTARHFLHSQNLHERLCRFDTVTIEPNCTDKKHRVEFNWITSAFEEHTS